MNNFYIIEERQASTIYGGLSEQTIRELMYLLGKLLGAAAKYLYDLFTSDGEPETNG